MHAQKPYDPAYTEALVTKQIQNLERYLRELREGTTVYTDPHELLLDWSMNFTWGPACVPEMVALLRDPRLVPVAAWFHQATGVNLVDALFSDLDSSVQHYLFNNAQ